MRNPVFSIVIPTCDRHLSLFHTIRSVLNSDFGDYEIIVSDNYSSPETYDVVRTLADSRIRYFRTPRRLSMSENWEFALTQCRGKYLHYLGDDDGLMPDAMSLAKGIMEKYPFQAVAWRRSNVYWWPDCISPGRRNFLCMHFYPQGPVFIQNPTRPVLASVFDCTSFTTYEILPMVYNAFVSRELVERIKTKSGIYFNSLVPDLWSGLQNAWHLEHYCYSHRPLSIAGICGKSNGWSFTVSPQSEMSKKFLDENGLATDRMIHPSLPQYRCNEITNASVFLALKEQIGAEADGLRINYGNLAKILYEGLLSRPDQYDDYLNALRELCAKHGIDMAASGFNIPQKPQNYVPMNDHAVLAGPRMAGSNIIGVNVYCPAVGVYDVAGAAKLLHGMLPPTPVV